MKKKISFILFVVSLAPLYASEEDVHNSQMLKVLFGRPFTINENEQRNILPLEMALYLTIDLFKNNPKYEIQAQNYLDDLKKFGVRNLPKLQDINFTSNQYHQRYTHRGWDWKLYPSNDEYNFQNIWNLRKQSVYLAALDKIFSFNSRENEKRDSFAALLYYVHILGDHIGDSKRTYMDRIPISPRPDYRFNQSGENSNNPTIYTELLYHLPRLFREQTNTVDYGMLIRYLERNKSRQFSTGTTIKDEEYAELQTFAKETLDTMTKYIPPLLRNENFFTRVFFR